MIEDLKLYPEYKSSGMPWLSQIPAHWEISRSKRLFSARKELALPGDVQLSATQAYGVIPQSEFEERVGRRVVRISMHLERRRHVEKDDFVISMRSFQGGLERAWASGAIRSSYVVLKSEAGVDIGYFAHLFKSAGYIRALQSTASFIRDGQDLSFSNFAGVDLPLPPLAEQFAMGRFLDHANRRIDRFIRAKRKLIALLNEQKQAIIHRAATRGLDPSAPTKDSGAPWLGEIPAHWDLIALGRLSTARCDGPFGAGLKSMHYTNGGVRVVRLQNIGFREFRGDASVFISAEHYATLGDHSVIAGDLLVAGLGDDKNPAGRACVAPNGLGPAMVKADCFRFRLKAWPGFAEFIAAHLSATAGAATACLSTGATRLRINLSTTASRLVAVPPVDERVEIIKQIESKCVPIDRARHETEHQIKLIREYRTRLIADVVTGQLDVRAAAARLPAEDPNEPVVPDLDDDAEAAADDPDDLDEDDA